MTPPAAGTTGQSGSTTPAAGTGTAATGSSGTTTPTAGTGVGTAGMSTSTGGMSVATGGTSAAGTGGTAGAATGGSTGGSCPGTGPAKTGMCKATANGIYAMKVTVDVWYQDEINSPPLFDAGRGKLVIYFRSAISNICDDASGGKVVNHPCGTRLPALYADATGGVIQIQFPDALWEKPGIPDYTTTGSSTGFDPMDTLSIAKTTGLVGIDLTAIDATWPTYMQTPTLMCSGGKMGKDCFPDMDGDGNPGVTVTIETDSATPPNPSYTRSGGWKYIPAPTSIPNALVMVGANTVYIGLRTRVGGSGVIGADCKSGAGAADVDDFESRVFDCTTKDGKCSATDATFVDQNTPIFHVLKKGAMPPSTWKHTRSDADAMLDRSASAGPLSSVVRLADIGGTVSCTDVRGAMFP